MLICVSKDSLIMVLLMLEVTTAVLVGFSCILGARAVLTVGGVLVCGSSITLAGLIIRL